MLSRFSLNRYLNLNARALRKDQVSHLLDTAETQVMLSNWAEKGANEFQQQKQQRQIKKGRKSYILYYHWTTLSYNFYNNRLDLHRIQNPKLNKNCSN